MLPYGRQCVEPDDIEAVREVTASDWLTTGPKVREFEERLCDVGQVNFASAVTSGTAALHTAYAALGVSRGTRVFTTPMTFVATAATAQLLGAEVRFVDIEPEYGCLDVSLLPWEDMRPGDVISLVDYAGVPADAASIRQRARDCGVRVLCDAAHSIGSSTPEGPVGSLGDVTTFSFFPTKNITTMEGGAVLTNDPVIGARAAAFKNHGLVRDPALQLMSDEGPWHQEVHEFGLNYRLPDPCCALGISQLAKLDRFRDERSRIFARYSGNLTGAVNLRLPTNPSNAQVMWHLYVIQVDASVRRALFEHLRTSGIGVQVNYIPVHWHPVFEKLGHDRNQCPKAEAMYRRIISLPIFPGLTDADIDRVCDVILKFLE